MLWILLEHIRAFLRFIWFDKFISLLFDLTDEMRLICLMKLDDIE